MPILASKQRMRLYDWQGTAKPDCIMHACHERSLPRLSWGGIAVRHLNGGCLPWPHQGSLVWVKLWDDPSGLGKNTSSRRQPWLGISVMALGQGRTICTPWSTSWRGFWISHGWHMSDLPERVECLKLHFPTERYWEWSSSHAPSPWTFPNWSHTPETFLVWLWWCLFLLSNTLPAGTHRLSAGHHWKVWQNPAYCSRAHLADRELFLVYNMHAHQSHVQPNVHLIEGRASYSDTPLQKWQCSSSFKWWHWCTVWQLSQACLQITNILEKGPAECLTDIRQLCLWYHLSLDLARNNYQSGSDGLWMSHRQLKRKIMSPV